MVLSKVPSVLSPFIIRDVLQLALQTACCGFGRGQTPCLLVPCGLERPRRSFWPRSRPKCGVVPAQLVVLPAPKFFVAHSATSMLFNTFVHGWVNEMVNRGVMCVFHAPVTLLKDLCSRRTNSIDQTSLKKDRALGPVLRDLRSQFTFS